MSDNKKQSPLTQMSEKFAPALMLLVIVLSFAVGYLFNKINSLEQSVNNGAVAGAVQPAAPTSGKLTEDKAKAIPAVTADDHIRGNKDADVTLIEYSDFQCPFCSRFHPTTLQAMDEYGDKLAIVYRHFPLDTLHPRAIPAAIASECIAEIGGEDAFWSFADYVFENQEIALTDLADTATKIGVNGTSVQTCLDADKYAQEVSDEYDAGAQAGVTGTPGNFVINKKGEAWLIPGAVDFATLKSTIDEALES